MTQNPQLHYTTGIFAEPEQAKTAEQALQSAGFSADQISANVQTFDPNPPASRTKVMSSARGAAIAGSLIGGLLGFLLGWYSPMLSVMTTVFEQPLQSALFASLIGGIVGSIGGGAFGALAGVNVPNEIDDSDEAMDDRDRMSHKYLVKVTGTEDELDQAIQILNQQGAKVQR
jgi:hypothetical protein